MAKKEIIPTRTESKVKVRTQFNLGGFNDDTHTGSISLTDPADNLSTENLLAKLLRGESVNARFVPEFDVLPQMSDDEAFKTIDVTRSGDFDLADVPALAKKAAQNKKALERIKKQIAAEEEASLKAAKEAGEQRSDKLANASAEPTGGLQGKKTT